jgi:hypothetical protein
LNVTVAQTNTWGDVDTYIARGTFPTFSSYIVKDNSVSKNVTLSVSPAPPGTYYIGTYSYFHVEYELEAVVIGMYWCKYSARAHPSLHAPTTEINQ